MNSKIKKLKERQAGIESFFSVAKSKALWGFEIRKWIVDATTHFVDVGVDPIIIDFFIRGVSFSQTKNGRGTHGAFKQTRFGSKYSLTESFLFKKTGAEYNPWITPIETALSVSRLLVEEYQDTERVIPNSFMLQFAGDKFSNLRNVFDILETNYEQGDTKGMQTALITATELLLYLISETRKEKTLGAKLKKIHNADTLAEKYGFRREVIWALNTARIIRNHEVEHPSHASTGDVGMSEAIGYTHLLMLFTNTLLASGNLSFD